MEAARNLDRVTRAVVADELSLLEGDEEGKWPLRARFLFILTAAAVCWAVPATIAYLVFAH